MVIDGPRYSETWGDPLRINIPLRYSLSAFGVLLTNFRNQGETFTIPGHTAICTGDYQSIANDDSQLPDYPSIFQAWLKNTNELNTKCCIVGAKYKLRVLSNCLYPDYFGHQSDSIGYINAIRKTDQYVGIIWNYIQNSSNYKDKTTLIVTNDHGRYLDWISGGYTSFILHRKRRGYDRFIQVTDRMD